MADLMRFGMLERWLLGLWIVLASAFMAAAMAAAYPDAPAELARVFRWWSYLAVGTSLFIIAAPAFRYLYRELVAPRLPKNPLTN